MELIIFASLYQVKEGLIFCVHRRTFYLRGVVEVMLPFFYMKRASAAKNSEVPVDALRGHSAPRGRILRYRGCIHLAATSNGRFTPLFFSTNRLATRLNPTSNGRFTLLFFIALICTKGSARPFGCAALKARVSLQIPLRYLRGAKITPILTTTTWPVRSTVQSFGAQALATASIGLHSFGAQSYRPTVRTALARKP